MTGDHWKEGKTEDGKTEQVTQVTQVMQMIVWQTGSLERLAVYKQFSPQASSKPVQVQVQVNPNERLFSAHSSMAALVVSRHPFPHRYCKLLPIQSQSASFLVGTTQRPVFVPGCEANKRSQRSPRAASAQTEPACGGRSATRTFQNIANGAPGLKGQRSEGAWKGSRTPGGFILRSHQNSRASSQRRGMSRAKLYGDTRELRKLWVVQQEGSANLSDVSQRIHCG